LSSDVDVDVDDDAMLPDFCGNSIFGEKRCGEMVLRRMLISGVPGSNPRVDFINILQLQKNQGPVL
jgi:hypothetical protein